MARLGDVDDNTTKLDGIEPLADVTNDANVRDALAGATLPVDFNTQNITNVGTVDGRDVSVDGTKLDGIEALADVTDVTNVAAAGAVMETLADAKGDLFAASAADTMARLAVGTNTHVLTADSAEATGMKWAAAGGGGGSITVEDEGTPLTTAVTLFDFAGAGVTVTEPVADQVLVTIPGAGVTKYVTTISAWTLDTGRYRADVTHSLGTLDVTVAAYTPADGLEVGLDDIDRTSTSVVRIWSATNTENVRVIVMSSAAGGTVAPAPVSFAWSPSIDGIYPATAPGREIRGSHPVWAFDQTTDEAIILPGYMPDRYAAGDVTVSIQWAGDGVTTGDVKWDVEWERMDTALDLDADSFATLQTTTTTTAGTDGLTVVTAITFTQAEADGIAAGEAFRIRLTRDANAGGDTMSADAQVVSCWIEEV